MSNMDAIHYLFMRKQMTKSPARTQEVEEIHSNGVKAKSTPRIDEEVLFNLFTADIMKMNIKFTR